MFRTTLALLASLLVLPASAATRVERVVSPGGIEAWLVRETATPMLAMEFAFRGGAAQDPVGKEGVANLVASTLDEGAGDLDSRAFQERMEQLALQLSFSASRDLVTGSVRTLTANRDAAFDLVRLALTQPRFEQVDLDRVRQAVMAQLRREQTDPNAIASRLFSEVAFPGHPYGRPARGTMTSVSSITPADLGAYHRRILSRDTLKIAVVGDIDAATLGRLLDRVFGALPARGERADVPVVTMAGTGNRRVVELDTPQTIIQFGLPGPLRKDPDFIPLFVLNHILGGGSFTSRLWTEVREKRGLTYSIGTGLNPLDAAGLFGGQTSTRNDRAGESLAQIETEIRRIAAEGPTAEELEKAKTFLVGSYLLRFDTSQRIAGQLLAIQLDDLGIDWIDRRNGIIEAVTMDDVRRVARRWLTGDLLVTMVGRPQGVTERRPGG